VAAIKLFILFNAGQILDAREGRKSRIFIPGYSSPGIAVADSKDAGVPRQPIFFRNSLSLNLRA
jgi:hypothetical protein